MAAAHAAADAGYKAYERRDFAAAVGHAERAVQLAPDRRDWWILLANAQLAAGNPAAAEQALQRAAQAKGDDGALAKARADLGRVRAQTAAGAMYQALQANDLRAAISLGRTAVESAPDNAAYRLVLVHALLRAGQFADADKVASETVALVPDSGVALAMRGYARHALGRAADGAADLDRALQQPGTSAASLRELRLLAIDLAIARGDAARATALLQLLPSNDAAAESRREYLRAMVPGTPVAIALVAPGIDCSEAATAQTCVLRASALPQAPGYAAATAAYKAMEAKDHARALEQARIATRASPSRRDWQLLHVDAALAAGQPEEAERAATAALALGPDATVLARRSVIRRRLGNSAGANEDAEAALRAGGGLPLATQAGLLADLGRAGEVRAQLAEAASRTDLTPAQRLDLAYLANRIGDPAAASTAFQQVDAAGALPATSLLDAGYAAMHARRDAEAMRYFERAVDAANSLQLKLDPQMVYDTRRTHAELERKWGVLASLTSRNGAGITPTFGTALGVPGGQRTVQAGAELYYRPWGFRNGEFVELFARGFQTLHSEAGGLQGGDSFQGAVGIRWKPLSGQNAVLSLSRVFGPEIQSDWLVQAAYSYDVGTDLRVDATSWWTTRFYAEVGRYLQHDPRNYALATLMVGRSYLLGEQGRTTIYPHGVAAWEYSSVDNPKSSAGIGPGVSVRHWFREDTYNAPRSYVDVTLQYRARLSGDDRMKGVYFNTLLSY